ncbi:tyrosine-type recombinase/integrase [Amycolatopsis sp. NPDC024027]|uniref:site-specific integrase n=1 Tax=Amycolatopsis sp. NPDC024027 TaxID=3154327 RepID=UPI0033F5B7BC
MGRPATPVGTYGVINVEKLPPTRAGKVRYRASSYFRMADGTLRLVRRQASTKGQATTRLKEALRELETETRDGDISKDTRFYHVVELWLEEIAQEAELGNLSPTTVSLYRRALKNWALPSLGQLRCREVLVTRCDKVVKKARAKASYDTAKTVKAALSGACDYAVRNGGMDANPIRSVGRMSRGKQKEVVTLSAPQRADLLAKLRAYAPTRQVDARGRSLGARSRIWLDLPDLMEAMLSSGARIGEVLAILGPDVEPTVPTVAVTHHVVRVPGSGLERRELRKGNVGGLLLAVPQWSVPMWQRRKEAAGNNALFASFTGELLDPSNVINRLTEAVTAVGYEWVTSHVFRKTVGTVLDEADLPITAIADQLGNTPAVAERHYRKQRVANRGNAEALEAMMPAAAAP